MAIQDYVLRNRAMLEADEIRRRFGLPPLSAAAQTPPAAGPNPSPGAGTLPTAPTLSSAMAPPPRQPIEPVPTPMAPSPLVSTPRPVPSIVMERSRITPPSGFPQAGEPPVSAPAERPTTPQMPDWQRLNTLNAVRSIGEGLGNAGGWTAGHILNHTAPPGFEATGAREAIANEYQAQGDQRRFSAQAERDKYQTGVQQERDQMFADMAKDGIGPWARSTGYGDQVLSPEGSAKLKELKVDLPPGTSMTVVRAVLTARGQGGVADRFAVSSGQRDAALAQGDQRIAQADTRINETHNMNLFKQMQAIKEQNLKAYYSQRLPENVIGDMASADALVGGVDILLGQLDKTEFAGTGPVEGRWQALARFFGMNEADAIANRGFIAQMMLQYLYDYAGRQLSDEERKANMDTMALVTDNPDTIVTLLRQVQQRTKFKRDTTLNTYQTQGYSKEWKPPEQQPLPTGPVQGGGVKFRDKASGMVGTMTDPADIQAARSDPNLEEVR